MFVNRDFLSFKTTRKWRAFRARPRAFYSLLFILTLTLVSLFAGFYATPKPFVAKYEGSYYFPLFKAYSEKTFGGVFDGEADYTDEFVKAQFRKGNNFALYAPIRWDALSINRSPALQHPSRPSKINWLGTDDRGRDVLARLIYGFRISLFFGVSLVVLEILIGTAIGAIEGYFGGAVDLFVERGIEIWSSIPILYLLIIFSGLLEPSILLLIFILALFGWMEMQSLVRQEFLKARQRDYVKAARALGVSSGAIIMRHILPNALTLVITRVPFTISAALATLVGLDYLGFGVPPPIPSLGELLRQGQANLQAWWIGIPTVTLIILLLVSINYVGEALLDIFDPRRL